jgi:hypothetical protein
MVSVPLPLPAWPTQNSLVSVMLELPATVALPIELSATMKFPPPDLANVALPDRLSVPFPPARPIATPVVVHADRCAVL